MKILRSKLARLYRLRERTFNILESKEVEVDFDKISEEINDLVLKIRDLKVKISKTNVNTIVSVEGREVTILELILTIADLRSELSRYAFLQPLGPVYLRGHAVEYIAQRKQDEIAEKIAELEAQKANVDKILQSNNWKTELLH
ncbi:MAG: hypothetical protein HWN65_06510 [Candidatus Helarchaeota archaeon]|nr:hypothetical protein [Candidatus Helarchaeota archaeon]